MPHITYPSDHSHLYPLKFHLTLFSYRPGLTINDISLLVCNGTNCLNLFHPIQILFSTAASASPPIFNISPKLQNSSTNSRFAWSRISALVLPLLETPHGHLTSFCITFCHSFSTNNNVGFIHIYSHASILHIILPLIEPFN